MNPKLMFAFSPTHQSIIETLSEVTTPLFAAIRREVAAIIARMHRTGYNKPLDPTTTSVFMQDLSDKLGYIRRQILAPLRIGELSKEWCAMLILMSVVTDAAITGSSSFASLRFKDSYYTCL